MRTDPPPPAAGEVRGHPPLFARFRGALALLLGRRPPLLQVAALCRREGPAGTEMLLMTSLDTGRWVLPKGWPMRGRSLAGAALREAWEEAGVVGSATPEPVGSYLYFKRRNGGYVQRVEVKVFPVQVRRMDKHFPERGRRRLVWLPLAEAATRVEEEGLRDLLMMLAAQEQPLAGGVVRT